MSIWGYHLITPFLWSYCWWQPETHIIYCFCFSFFRWCRMSSINSILSPPRPGNHPPTAKTATASEGDRERSLGRSNGLHGGSFCGDTFQVELAGLPGFSELDIPSLKLTFSYISHLKMDGWKMIHLLFGGAFRPIFRCGSLLVLGRVYIYIYQEESLWNVRIKHQKLLHIPKNI